MKACKYVLIFGIFAGAAAGCFAGERPAADEKKDIQSIVEGNNKFALELYAKLRGTDGNLFLSPYSISTALSMTHAGANGRTAEQMAEVLHLPQVLLRMMCGTEDNIVGETVPQWVHTAFGKIIKDLNARGKKGGYELRVANALWGQKGYAFLDEFLELIEANYDGRLSEVDFAAATEKARKTINAWVEKKTNNKIKELIKPGVLNRLTRLVLTNAIYFKGNWDVQFKKNRTHPAPFTLANGSKVSVPMMNQKERFKYMETEDFQALELPYVDNELSMVIFLPKRTDGLADFEKTLTAEKLSERLNKLNKREVIVSIPKFKMTSQFSLASVLKSMGMADAFVPDVADFSGMNGKRDLFIQAVIHKAFVEVNEEGTEAAAATGVVIGITSMPARPPVFRADHPFLFLIRDNLSGSILFVGRVMDPKT